MTARYPYPGTPGAIGRPRWQCPPVTAEASHAATGATAGTCAVCIARPGACHCTACTPYCLGASIEEVALDLDRAIPVARRVLHEHGTIVERRKAGSRVARAAALLLLLALPPASAPARGHGPLLLLPPRPIFGSIVPSALRTRPIDIEAINGRPTARGTFELTPFFRFDDGSLYRCVVRQIHEDGALRWRATFEPVARSRR